MEPQIEKFFSEAHRRSYTEGEAKGEAKGKAEALLLILRRRSMAMTDDQQRRIVTCTDLATVERWLDRAFSVASGKSSPMKARATAGAKLRSPSRLAARSPRRDPTGSVSARCMRPRTIDPPTTLPNGPDPQTGSSRVRV
ncbi:MAG TPA: hypothetical protein VHN14_02005 [Kofleriaceae bacterium]|jgi:hypothetical protein|nr:hypothetical protein [Kofleriaceae bacterium]